eukprot:TRINITY_DN5259_c0_g1_i1.p2 TRINITY_DN5259_c0_g1~~TRINITY_DN5259_c0_g1_i1.p2  ORF type:complete len:112 (-),score=8.48 TRINITY_DN5259_c0_g1_i1:110-445(-)
MLATSRTRPAKQRGFLGLCDISARADAVAAQWLSARAQMGARAAGPAVVSRQRSAMLKVAVPSPDLSPKEPATAANESSNDGFEHELNCVNKLWIKPVSYTHLTLPTKRIV